MSGYTEIYIRKQEENYRYSLIFQQNLTSDSLLNINYSATSISFLYCYVKIHWFILHFETLNHGWFYNIMHWSLGKQWFYKIRYFICHTYKTYVIFIKITTDLIIKTTNYWESQPHRHKFSETVILAWKLNFYHWQQILTVVFLEATVYLHLLSRKKFNTYSRSLNAIARHPFHLNLILYIPFKVIVDLQCCANFCYTAKWFSYTYTYIHAF